MSSSKPTSVFIDGLLFPPLFKEEAVTSAQTYRPRDNDVIIATYPKCGTTWTQAILALVFTQGDPKEARNMFQCSTFLELKGASAAEAMPRPGILKTHLPRGRAPWSDDAKYVFVARNPKDCCVSYYHHYRGHGFAGSFDDFFEMFIGGDVNFGDYFDHLMGWEERRNKPNILFMTYEEMKENTEAAILKMASFIDDRNLAEPLRIKSDRLDNVLKYSSLNRIKGIIDKCPLGTEENETKTGHGVEESSQKQDAFSVGNKRISNLLVRKGITGDWRNHLTEEQSERLSEKFFKRAGNSDYVHIWKNYM